MKLLIGADLVPTQTNIEQFQNGDALALVGEALLAKLQSAQYRIFNLEVPLVDTLSPIDKNGPALIAPSSAIAGYKALGVDCLTLANNHIMDHGKQGLESTLALLQEVGIASVGVGEDLQEAAKPLTVELSGKKIGIYACAEHEFSIAGETAPGANSFAPLESLDHVAALKTQCDYVIVLYHGGKEHYRYPSPELQKVCRKLVEKGADLVICQHSHCIGCEEKHQNGTIIYGQGNFLFDRSASEYWQTSLLVELGDDFEISYIPLVKTRNAVRLADETQSAEILQAFYQRSAEILQPGFVEKQYAEFARQMFSGYLIAFAGIRRGFVYRAVNKLTGHRFESWLLGRKYSKKQRIAIRNIVECEAHRELLLEGLTQSQTG